MKQVITFVFVGLAWLQTTAQQTAHVTKTKPQPAVKPAAQKLVPEKEPPITDTLEYNIKKTIEKLSLFVLDPDIPFDNLAEAYLGTKFYGQPYYSSIIRFPGAVETTIEKKKVNRAAGTTEWVWTAILTRTPRNTENKEMFTALKEKADKILKTISYTPRDEKNKFTGMWASYDDIPGYKTADVSLVVYFTKTCYQTEQQAIDSLAKLYAPGLTNIETAEDAAKKYGGTLLAEGVSETKATALLSAELKKAADKDIKLGFQLLSGVPYDLKSSELMAVLSSDQREKIRSIAQAYLDAYKEQKPFDIKTFDPSPPKLQYYNADGGTYTSTGTVNPNLYKQPEPPQGKQVVCPICNGTRYMEVVDYSHTYEGIFSTIKTSTSHWTTCTYCGGEGWVTKYKKKK